MVCIVEQKVRTNAWKQVGRPLYKSVQSARDHVRLLGLKDCRIMSVRRKIVLVPKAQ